MRKNFLLASQLSVLGAVKRVVFFGWNRTPTADETKQMQEGRQLLAPKTQLLVSGAVKSPHYNPAVQAMLQNMDAAIADYKQTGSYSPQGA
jgi:hypothetical protein